MNAKYLKHFLKKSDSSKPGVPMPKETISDINKLVSLTFDESPKVRKQAAESLGKIDDPIAVFALMELSYDKDQEVKDLAQKILDKKQSKGEELMSFADVFSKPQEEIPEEDMEKRKKKVLSPITQLFEKKLGKQKAKAARKKMMPAIEKAYMKAVGKKKKEGNGRKAIQEFLTTYLEAISSIEPVNAIDENDVKEVGKEDVIEESGPEEPEEIAEDIGEIGRVEDAQKLVEELESEDFTEEEEGFSFKELPDTMFKAAYERMMLSNGDETLMKREMKKMSKQINDELNLAFKLAKKKFKETKITNLTEIKNGIRNLNTDILEVTSAENFEYTKGKKKKVVTRLLVKDEDENEAIVYLFDGRGESIDEGVKIKVQKGQVKTFNFTGETAITVGNRGNVYIVL